MRACVGGERAACACCHNIYNCYVRVIIIESFYICYMTTECHEALLLYDEVMSIPANSCASCRRVARVRRVRAW